METVHLICIVGLSSTNDTVHMSRRHQEGAACIPPTLPDEGTANGCNAFDAYLKVKRLVNCAWVKFASATQDGHECTEAHFCHKKKKVRKSKL